MRQPTWRARFDWFRGPAESPRWPQRLVSGPLMGLVLVSAGASALESNPSLKAAITRTAEERLLAGTTATGRPGSGAGGRPTAGLLG